MELLDTGSFKRSSWILHQGTGHPHRLFSCAVPELEARGCQRGTTFHRCNWVRCHRPPHADCGRASARILECRPTLAAGETFQLLSACRLLHLAWFWRVEVAHRAAPTQREDSVRATPMPTAPLSLESIPFFRWFCYCWVHAAKAG